MFIARLRFRHVIDIGRYDIYVTTSCKLKRKFAETKIETLELYLEYGTHMYIFIIAVI